MSVKSVVVRVVAPLLVGLLVLVVWAAPGLAATAPETPILAVEAPVHATFAVFHAVLEPVATPEAGTTYSFVYREGLSCVGGRETVPGMVLASGQEVSEPVEKLKPDAKYTVCLVVKNTATQTGEASATFETATPPETPVTLKAEPVAGTTATLNGELNPKASAKDGYYFSYDTNGTCEPAFTTTPGTETTETKRHVATPVSELEGSTEYTFCVVEANEAGETATGPPLKFKTAAAVPVVPVEGVSGVTPFDAVLEGQVNAEKQETTYHYEYSTSRKLVEEGNGTSVGEGSLPGTSGVQGASPVDLGGGLTPGTPYYYRLVASDETGKGDGEVKEFTAATLVKPTVEGEAALTVTQTTVTFAALVNPEFQPLSACEFEVSGGVPLVELPVSCTPSATELGDGGTPMGTGASVSGLTANSTYHYTLLASNATGQGEGLSETFTTMPLLPTASTGGASAITTTSAMIAGSVNPENSGQPGQDDTTYSFQYGSTDSYGSQTEPGDAHEGTTALAQTATLTGLEPGKTYHYRIVASNNNQAVSQTGFGEDQTFTTLSTPPVLSGVTVASVTQNEATITATLNPQGLPTRYELQVGGTPGALQPVAAGDTTSQESTVALTLTAQSLTPGTTYYYRLVAVNPDNPLNPETNEPQPTETQGSFTTSPTLNTTTPPTPPALIPYTPLTELQAQQAKEDKGASEATKPLTRAQKLNKALKACKHHKNKAKRTQCLHRAHKRFGARKSA
jgi:hypothetical protein